jgi:GTP cyclohydrolase II
MKADFRRQRHARFDDDERDFGIAAHMLRMLNCTRIVLLTNNPNKLDGLTTAGIEIAAVCHSMRRSMPITVVT